MSAPAGIDPATGEVLDVLTVDEAAELEEHETTIGAGLGTFRAVGDALLRIREGRLYRRDHDSFDEYCVHVWGMSKRHANRLAMAAQVAAVLERDDDDMGPIGLTSESQARELAPLLEDPPALRAAYADALEVAAGPPTAEDLRAAVKPRLPKPKTPKLAAPPPPSGDPVADTIAAKQAERDRAKAEREARERARVAEQAQAKAEEAAIAALKAHAEAEDADLFAASENAKARSAIRSVLDLDPVLFASYCRDPERRTERLDELEQWIATHREALASTGASLHVINGGAP
jgi:hypothetical protein